MRYAIATVLAAVLAFMMGYAVGKRATERENVVTGSATTTKPNSPATTGSGNTIVYGMPENGNPASWSYPRKAESGLSSPKGGSK